MNDGQIFIQWEVLVINALKPAAIRFALPINRTVESFVECAQFYRFVMSFVEKLGEGFFQLGRTAGFEPVPTLVAPEAALAVAARFDEFEKLAVGDRCPGDAKRFEHDLMGPLLVVEDEGEILGRADQVFATGDLDVTGTSAAIDGGRRLALDEPAPNSLESGACRPALRHACLRGRSSTSRSKIHRRTILWRCRCARRNARALRSCRRGCSLAVGNKSSQRVSWATSVEL